MTPTETVEFATSMSRAYFDRCGREMVRTFLANVDPSVRLRIYHEASAEGGPGVEGYDAPGPSGRLLPADLLRESGYLAYAAAIRGAVEAKVGGAIPADPAKRPGRKGYDYRWDALTFGKKGFAFAAAAKASSARWLFWADADIVFRKPLTVPILKIFVGDAEVAYFGRKKQHSETGFYGVDLASPAVRKFVDIYRSIWESRSVLSIPEGWTDCHVFDLALRQSPVQRKRNLSATPEGHVIAASPVGEYIDHRKGPRKDKASSPEAR